MPNAYALRRHFSAQIWVFTVIFLNCSLILLLKTHIFCVNFVARASLLEDFTPGVHANCKLFLCIQMLAYF